MAFDTAQLDADLAVMMDDLSVSITAGGTTFSGTRMSRMRLDTLNVEGMRDNNDLAVYYRIADYATSIAVGDTVDVNGATYRVIGKDIDDAERLVRLDLGQEFAP